MNNLLRMFGLGWLQDMRAKLEAIDKTMAVIEFALDGTVIRANSKFLHMFGYSATEVQGKHHSMFVSPEHRDSPAYREFWRRLSHGEHDSSLYKRIAKGGREMWVQATYSPIPDWRGNPTKIVKLATDVTTEQAAVSDYKGQFAAIHKAQAVAEFDLEGKILSANENFLSLFGYRLEEIRDHHHSMFVEPEFRSSATYRRFWEKLGAGQFDAATYKRIGKHGKEVWIQASYNPILNANGKPCKVVKYATDVTPLHVAVTDTQAVVKAAVAGDLAKRVPMEDKSGQIAILCNSVNLLVESMGNLVAGAKEAAEGVQIGAVEIAAGNANLSKRTEEQASSLEETSASMKEMSSRVMQTASHTSQASEAVQYARKKAEASGEVVGAAVVAMARINDSSHRIAEIIGVIDGIAFQTKLLALNAAVEAARAGELGRGFAVVAAEVGNLASRSANAAREIKGLINDSTIKVAEGQRLVNESGNSLAEIVSSVKKAADIVSEIALAGREQSLGIEQVNHAVAQIDAFTQHNAALVEEAAAASASIAEQAKDLTALIARYTVGHTPTPCDEPLSPLSVHSRSSLQRVAAG